MKKFISMVMAAAMVVSLVPATAFAASGTANFKVVDDVEVTEKMAKEDASIEGAQLQMKVTDINAKVNKMDTFEIKLSFDKAVVTGIDGIGFYKGSDDTAELKEFADVDVDVNDDNDKLTITFTEKDTDLKEGDIIVIDLAGDFEKTSEGTQATVKVSGDFGSSDELVFGAIVEKGIEVELDDDVVDVAVEETAALEVVVVEPSAGDTFADVVKATGTTEMTLKLSKGFEFANEDVVVNYYVPGENGDTVVEEYTLTSADVEDNEITLTLGSKLQTADKIEFINLVVDAVTAKEGDVATLTVKMEGADSVKVEVAQVVDFKVVMELTDEDEDVPVFYNGVNSDNKGLTVDDDHKALEVTLKETFAGAWSNHKDWTLTLPEGVHVVAVEAEDETAGQWEDIEDDFYAAYQEGDHESFVFEKRTFTETASDKDGYDEAHEITFVLTVVADPDFVGDVVLTLEGDAVDTQEVTIAKFVAPYTIKAEQNDLKIDYRYTEVGTDIVITEAEAGLWEKGMEVTFQVEKGNYITFEDDAVVSVNEESEMEIDDTTDTKAGTITLEVEEESDEEAAVITISGIELFMQRNIPAGPYDLEIADATTIAGFVSEQLYAPDCDAETCKCTFDEDHECTVDDDHECYVADVADYSDVAKEAWINVVTAGREADDASFTTKVVVPVGEAYIVAGEQQVALDVPAYVNAAGYTMLPVRAVAVALGINTQNVLWDQATKTVTILYGQRIITMQVGAKVVYVNGSAIPASASVEIVDGRTFLPMRDLATALGVTDITWDAATKTATLNGNA